MKNIKIPGILLLLLSLLTSCAKTDTSPAGACDQGVQISASTYESAPTDEVTINSLVLSADCLTINFSAGGCSGSTWDLKLVDSGAVMESFPPQRNLIFSLKNEELCYAYITKEISFNLSELQVEGNQVVLNITNTDDEVLYVY